MCDFLEIFGSILKGKIQLYKGKMNFDDFSQKSPKITYFDQNDEMLKFFY